MTLRKYYEIVLAALIWCGQCCVVLLDADIKTPSVYTMSINVKIDNVITKPLQKQRTLPSLPRLE